jgi:hypothetical protein
MNKKYFIPLVVLLFLVASLVAPFSVFARASEDGDEAIPEKDGTYDVPGHPNLKVRVFVHNPKPEPFALTCSDPNSLVVVDPVGWHLPGGTWTYNLNSGSVPSSVGSGNLATMSADAFSRWASAANRKVTFSKGLDTTATRRELDGKNIITWGKAPGSALGITYIWYSPDSGFVTEVDTIMNTKVSWSWTPPSHGACGVANTYDAQDILTHELGHWLGLNDEYATSYRDNTMYGYGSKAEIKKDTLTIGDIDGVVAIYK